METGPDSQKQRPQTALTPPPVDCGDEVLLKHLLQIELERLSVAQQIEIDRETVFPETSVIIRDVMKLHASLRALGGGEDEEEAPSGVADSENGRLAEHLRRLRQAASHGGRP